MKLKEKLALEAIELRDLIKDESRNLFGEGFIAGFERARELALMLHDHYTVDVASKYINELGEEEL